MIRNPFDEESLVVALACPNCGSRLQTAGPQLSCPMGHAFDVARHGYVSLLPGGRRAATGDNAAMVAARVAFLSTGHYDRIAQAVSEVIPHAMRGLCVDIAGGTGYYLAAVLTAHPGLVGLSLDLSPFAARRAAQAHPRMAAVTADVWQPFPLQTGSAACILSIFGPRNGDEMMRVLESDGMLVVVTPTDRHLKELRLPLGMIGIESNKQDRLDAQLADFTRDSTLDLEYLTTMSAAEIESEVMMGPSAHHIGAEVLDDRIRRLPAPLGVTVSVTVSTYVPSRV